MKVRPVHFSAIQKESDEGASHIKHTHANFSEHFGLKRVGAHHVVLKPGYRTSYPHAESHEEEFIFVVEGTVHGWINGDIYEFGPGWAIGFPAGTGIAHNFINNSQKDVRLIVAGERSKRENLCSFPVNPELEPGHPIWWADFPPQKFGPHNGLPGPVAEIKRNPPPFAAYVPDLKKSKPFSYPGDTETFGEGVRLTDHLGLKALGIWLDILPPGFRSCYPHAHTHEEEFCFVLEGSPQVWLDGEVTPLKPGEAIAFQPMTGISHCLINDSDSPAVYIGIGETADYPDEKIIYPMNPVREEEMKRKGFHWTDAPKMKMGPHNAMPARKN